jgi:hypothetical protein
MTRVAKLTGDTPEFDRIKALEQEHEPLKVTITLDPQLQFIIEAGIQHRLHCSKSAAVRQLLEAAAFDLVEAKGYELDGEEFRAKYLTWLSPPPATEAEEEEFQRAAAAGEISFREQVIL